MTETALNLNQSLYHRLASSSLMEVSAMEVTVVEVLVMELTAVEVSAHTFLLSFSFPS